MKKITTLSLVLVVAMSCIYLSTAYFHDNKLQQENRQLTVSGSSQSYTEDQLVNLSDKIVKAKIIKVKDKFTKAMDASTSDGEKVTVKVPYIIYELEVSEDLENSDLKGTIELVLMDGMQNDTLMKIGEDSIFFLQRSPRQDIFNGTYIPLSLEQGIYNTADDNGQIESKLTKEHIKYKDLVEKIKVKKSKE